MEPDAVPPCSSSPASPAAAQIHVHHFHHRSCLYHRPTRTDKSNALTLFKTPTRSEDDYAVVLNSRSPIHHTESQKQRPKEAAKHYFVPPKQTAQSTATIRHPSLASLQKYSLEETRNLSIGYQLELPSSQKSFGQISQGASQTGSVRLPTPRLICVSIPHEFPLGQQQAPIPSIAGGKPSKQQTNSQTCTVYSKNISCTINSVPSQQHHKNSPRMTDDDSMYYPRIPLVPQAYPKYTLQRSRLTSPEQPGASLTDQSGGNLTDRLLRWFHIGSPTHGLAEAEHSSKTNHNLRRAQFDARRRCRSQPPQRLIVSQKPLRDLQQCTGQQMAKEHTTYGGNALISDVQRHNSVVIQRPNTLSNGPMHPENPLPSVCSQDHQVTCTCDAAVAHFSNFDSQIPASRSRFRRWLFPVSTSCPASKGKQKNDSFDHSFPTLPLRCHNTDPPPPPPPRMPPAPPLKPSTRSVEVQTASRLPPSCSCHSKSQELFLSSSSDLHCSKLAPPDSFDTSCDCVPTTSSSNACSVLTGVGPYHHIMLHHYHYHHYYHQEDVPLPSQVPEKAESPPRPSSPLIKLSVSWPPPDPIVEVREEERESTPELDCPPCSVSDALHAISVTKLLHSPVSSQASTPTEDEEQLEEVIAEPVEIPLRTETIQNGVIESSIVNANDPSVCSDVPVTDMNKLDQRRVFLQNMNQLKRTGWYWGPLTIEEAEQLLRNRPNGSFLVRDSGHELYILSVSFRAENRTYHTRIEHAGGKFSFTVQGDTDTTSPNIAQFINHVVAESERGRTRFFLRQSALTRLDPPAPPDPYTDNNNHETSSRHVEARLLYPVSRFLVVHSLAHLCRFEILLKVRRDHIDQLPLPNQLKNYLQERQYYTEFMQAYLNSIDALATQPD